VTIQPAAIATQLDAAVVMCRNMMDGPTVIAADAKRNYEIIFAGKDDPGGEDIQPIPNALLATPQFQKAIRQGILVVVEGEDNPVVQAALSKQSTTFRDRMAADAMAAREVLDAPSDQDILVVTCIGPGTREGAVCGENVPVRSKDAASDPPLCSRHAHLADFAVKRGKNPWVLEGVS
jgi:hypothetical protein